MTLVGEEGYSLKAEEPLFSPTFKGSQIFGTLSLTQRAVEAVFEYEDEVGKIFIRDERSLGSGRNMKLRL